MRIKKAEMKDLHRIMEIYKSAQDYMIESGNPDQWGRTYPEPELIKTDILEGRCLVICEEGETHGVFALFEDADPTYAIIEDGSWLNDEPYVTIHRLAGDGKVHGIFKCASDYSKGLSKNVRVDTHENNKVMQRLIEGNGFQKCGIIYVRNGSKRIAYQWAAPEDR